MVHGHNVGQWVKTMDLRFKTDSESVIFSDGSYYVPWIILCLPLEFCRSAEFTCPMMWSKVPARASGSCSRDTKSPPCSLPAVRVMSVMQMMQV